MSIPFYILYTIIYLGLLIWGAKLYRRSRRAGTLLILLITAGVFYDNLILSLGNLLGAGRLLYGLSLPRFWLHQLVLPWLIYAVYEQLRDAQVSWAGRPLARWAALAVSAGVMVIGILTRLVPLRLEAAVLDGVQRYVGVGVSGPPLVSILSIGIAGALGVFYGIKKKWPWTSLAAVLVFVGEGIADEATRRLLGSGLEIGLVVVLLMVEARLAVRAASVNPQG